MTWSEKAARLALPWIIGAGVLACWFLNRWFAAGYSFGAIAVFGSLKWIEFVASREVARNERRKNGP